MSARPPLSLILFCTAALFAGASNAASTSGQGDQAQANAAATAAEMMIEAGRLGVILDQTESSIKLRSTSPTEEPVETTAQQQLYAVHELRAAVLRYNVMQFDACRAGVISGDLCATPYLPDWLKEPPDTVPPAAVVVTRVHDTMNHIVPFWKAMCVKAVALTHDEAFCQIE